MDLTRKGALAGGINKLNDDCRRLESVVAFLTEIDAEIQKAGMRGAANPWAIVETVAAKRKYKKSPHIQSILPNLWGKLRQCRTKELEHAFIIQSLNVAGEMLQANNESLCNLKKIRRGLKLETAKRFLRLQTEKAKNFLTPRRGRK